MDDWLSGDLDGSDATPELRGAIPRLEFRLSSRRQKRFDFVRPRFAGVGGGAEDVFFGARVGHGNDLASVLRRGCEGREDFAPMDVEDFRCGVHSSMVFGW